MGKSWFRSWCPSIQNDFLGEDPGFCGCTSGQRNHVCKTRVYSNDITIRDISESDPSIVPPPLVFDTQGDDSCIRRLGENSCLYPQSKHLVTSFPSHQSGAMQKSWCSKISRKRQTALTSWLVTTWSVLSKRQLQLHCFCLEPLGASSSTMLCLTVAVLAPRPACKSSVPLGSSSLHTGSKSGMTM